MKKILITGINSYIGTSFEKYLKEHYTDRYIVDSMDMIEDGWRNKSFEGYDSILHVAGIVHQKETKQNAQLYYEINRDMAFEVAQKAKSEGVRQLIFISSMSVYGMNTGIITKQTKPNPKNYYGKSKWEAEEIIAPLNDEKFKVCILRPPMVYGKGCKGNFQTVVSIIKRSPVFPKVKNKRSMLYIDNLSSFMEMCVDKDLSGLFFPQNREYVCTLDMAKLVADTLNKKVCFGYLTGLAVRFLRLFLPIAKKAFGTLIYQGTEDFDFSYIVADNEESIMNSVE